MNIPPHTLQPTRPNKWLGWLGVTIALSAPAMQWLLGSWFKSVLAFPLDRFMSLLVMWLAMAVALGIAHYGEDYPLARFGFARTPKPLRARLIEWILTALATLVGGAVVIGFSTYVRRWLTGETMSDTSALVAALPAWVLIPAWFTSMTEEVLFRSYPIERLIDLTGRPWLAGLVTMLLFAFLHLFGWDWIHVVTLVLPASFLFTVFYLWRRNLALNMFIHGLLNMHLLVVALLQLAGVPLS